MLKEKVLFSILLQARVQRVAVECDFLFLEEKVWARMCSFSQNANRATIFDDLVYKVGAM